MLVADVVVLRLRSSLWLGFAAAALLASAHAACTSEGPDLNPQPLPPASPPDRNSDNEGAPSGSAGPMLQDAAAPKDGGGDAADGGPTDGGPIDGG